MVHIKNLVKRYGDVIALDHLNLDVRQGEVFGLLGPNGSGKTTAIYCILALLRYDRGAITVMGQPMSAASYAQKREIGVVLQNIAVFEQMNVEENIDYFCGLYISDRHRRKQLVKEAIEFTDLGEHAKIRPKKLSGGLQRRLNIACGIAHKPKLLIMDEPTVAVDPQSRNKILQGISELNRSGSTVIYTSHYMEEVEQICSRIAILDHGRVLATGTNEELKSMIRHREKVTVQDILLSDHQLSLIRKLPDLDDLSYESPALSVRFQHTGHNLLNLLDLLREQEIAFGTVYSERPTLNDVFLEITGTELRD